MKENTPTFQPGDEVTGPELMLKDGYGVPARYIGPSHVSPNLAIVELCDGSLELMGIKTMKSARFGFEVIFPCTNEPTFSYMSSGPAEDIKVGDRIVLSLQRDPSLNFVFADFVGLVVSVTPSPSPQATKTFKGVNLRTLKEIG
jgi:hypothetical protein